MAYTAYIATDRLRALARGRELPDRTLGAALFADISGFTALTEALEHELGPRDGAEELTLHLNAVYDALIDVVHRLGGSVIGFSGDAITCWFDASAHGQPRDPESNLRRACMRAVQAALGLQRAIQAMERIQTPSGRTFTLALKIAVAAGPARRFVVGRPDIQRLDVLAGATVDRLAAAEHQARQGEIILSHEVCDALGAALEIAEWRDDDTAAERFAVVRALHGAPTHERQPRNTPWRPSQPEPPLDYRSWLLPAVYARLSEGRGDLPTEIRSVVALFLRFSSPDYDGDDGAGAKLDSYVGWVQEVLGRYGGVLMQLTIGDKGSYLYATFGAPVTYENDAERALRAALALVIPPENLAWAGAARIGIGSGTMRTGTYGGRTRLTYGVMGDAANVAARLMMQAGPGQIFVSQTAQRHGAGSFAWESLPPLMLKGKTAPLPAFRLAGTHDLIEPDFYSGAFVGREASIDALMSAVRPIFEGRFAGICYVDGEAGIGKSRLVYEFRQGLSHQQVQWLYCPTEQILGGPLHPFSYFLRGYFEQATHHGEAENQARFEAVLERLAATLAEPGLQAESVVAELQRTRSFLAALVGLSAPGSLYEQLDPKLRFENTLYAIANLLRAASLCAPLVIELEDGHWLDHGSRELVALLSRELSEAPVLIVCSARPDDTGRPFRLALAPGTPERAIDLQALAPATCRALAAQLLKDEIGDEIAASLYEQTAGNPFFLEQVALDLRERGALAPLQQAGQHWNEAMRGAPDTFTMRPAALVGLPNGINAVLVARLDRLGDSVRDVVQMASVLGREWSLPILSAMRRDDADVYGKVRQAEFGQIWKELTEVRYLFRHVLLRDAAYAMQARTRLRELHRRAAAAIEHEHGKDLQRQAAILAYHYQQAEDRERELRYARLAGEWAVEQFANADAVGFFSRALALAPRDDLAARYELLLAREYVYHLQGERTAQMRDISELTELAEQLRSPAREAQVLLRQANYAETIGDYPAAIGHARQAVEHALAAGVEALAARGYLEWGKGLRQQANYAEARAQLEQALRYAQTAQLAQVEIQSLRFLGNISWEQGDYADAQASFGEALRLSRASHDKLHEGVLLKNLGNVAIHQHDHGSALAYYEQALALVRATGDRQNEGLTLNNLGSTLHKAGDYAPARASYEQALALVRATGHQRNEALVLQNVSRVVNQQGEHLLARDYAQQSFQIAQSIGARHIQGFAALALGYALAELHEHDAATDAFHFVVELRQALQQPHLATEAQAGLARLALQAGDHNQASAYTETILAFLDQGVLDGIEDLAHVELTCFQVLRARGDPRAQSVLATAYTRLQEQAAMFDPEARRLFLGEIQAHRDLIAIWQEHMASASG
jgi:predicted ATPase/class 3 adenylate cyclase